MAVVSTIEPDLAVATTCPVCHSGATEPSIEGVADFEYDVAAAVDHGMWHCADCASEFVWPRPTDADLVAFYPDDYHCYNEDHGRLARLLVDRRAEARGRLYRSLASGSRPSLFDVGAGDCRHFDELRRFCDMEFAGIEINPDMAARARARGYDVATGTLERADLTGLAGRFDIVSMNHVLEHVVDPDEVLRRCWQLLKPGGHLLGQLPTADCWGRRLFGRHWGGYHFPRHLQLFSRTGLAGRLRAAGFVDTDVTSALHIDSAISLQNLLVGRGVPLRLTNGRSRWFGAFMVAVAPFEIAAKACDRADIVDFRARKPS